MPSFLTVNYEGIQLGGLKRRELFRLTKIYRDLNEGRALGLCKVLLVLSLSEKVCILAREGKEIVGFEMFYINREDLRNGTIHEGYVGVIAEARGKGVGTLLRRKAGEHLYRAGFIGVTSRISADNCPSLKSSEKVGFRIRNTYYDSRTGEKRYYLVWKFTNALKSH